MGETRRIGGGVLAAATVPAGLLLDRSFPHPSDAQLLLAWIGLAGIAAIGIALAFWPNGRGAKARPVERDAIIDEGICFAASGEWGKRWGEVVGDGIGDYGAEWQRVRQLAADGKLTIWGKRHRMSAYAPVPAAFWVDHQPEWFSMWKGDARTERASFGAADEQYHGLMVSRAEFEQHWQPKKKRRGG